MGVPYRGGVPSFPAVPQNVGYIIMTVIMRAKLGSQGMKAGTERQKKYLIFRGVAGCPVVLLPSCLSGFLSMCKKMAHSAQLNIKVRSPFFRLAVVCWLSVFLALAGCRSVGSCFAGVARCGGALYVTSWPGWFSWFGFPCLDSI